jgi:hypothetical protein
MAISILFALQSGCGNVNKNMFEPLVPPSTGVVISGLAHAQGSRALQGVVVTLEAIEGGVSASVYQAMQGRGPTAPAVKTGAQPPLAGAPALAEGRHGLSAALATPSRATVTDARGRFAFEGVPAGAYLLTGVAPNHLAGIVRTTVRPLSAAAAETTVVDIAMMPTGKFYGAVTLENATNHQSTLVYVDGSSYVAVTNAAGDYQIEGVPVGNWTVRGTHPGYLDRSVTGSILAAGDSIPLTAFQLPLNSNIPPVAAAINPTSPVSHVPANFSGSGSDDDGTIVNYEWDFENDGTFDFSSPSSAATTHAYATSGSVTAKLRVTDNQGAIGLDAITFNIVDGVFVSAAGNDADPGTYNQPVATLSQGLVISSLFNRKYVFIGTGTYTGAPTFPGNIEFRGGYTPGTTWTRTAGNYSVFNVGLSPAQVVNVSVPTLISGLRVVASNQVAPGASSIALRVLNSSSAVQFVDCQFAAGSGGNGSNSASGVAGGNASGGSGQSGGTGGLPGGGNGGTGGGGGLAGNGGPGGAGGNFCGSNSGGFGGTGFTCSTGGGGSNGFNTCPLGDGANGSTVSGFGTVAGGVWTPASGLSGANGAGGAGGGGGGGGGGQNTGFLCGVLANGGPGGGGGGGGGGGTGGLGGTGGGASMAVLLYNSSPGFTSCTFTSGSGGAGGAGGNGGGFGLGAFGAGGLPGQTGGGPGGNGAIGNRGGAGGGGGGGAGGVSVGIAVTGTSGPSISSASYTIGIGGSGGSGGFHPVTAVQAPAGPNGASANVVAL